MLALVAGALAGPALVDASASTASARGRADDESTATPLSVQMTGMSPAVIPTKGRLVIRGVVTNVSPETWSDINVAPFMSAEPMTTRDELARRRGHRPGRHRGQPPQRPRRRT